MNAAQIINERSSYRIDDSDVSLGRELLDQPDNATDQYGAVESIRLATVRYGSTTMYCLVQQFDSRYEGVEAVGVATPLRPDREMALRDRSLLDAQTSYGGRFVREA